MAVLAPESQRRTLDELVDRLDLGSGDTGANAPHSGSCSSYRA